MRLLSSEIAESKVTCYYIPFCLASHVTAS